MFKTIFFKLTYRLELFTYLVNVPVAIYFSAITGTLKETHEFVYLSVGSAIAGTIGACIGIGWRWFFLKREIGIIQNPQLPDNLLRQSKIKLLKYPLMEPIVITLRWIFAAALAHVIFDIFAGKVHSELHMTYPFLMVLMLPLAYISFLYISEITIRPVYQTETFKNIDIDFHSIPQFSTLKRISFSMIALMLLPLVVLGYMLTGISFGTIKIEDPFFHLGIMVCLFSIPVALSAYVCTKSIKNSIHDVSHVLSQLGKGQFNIVCSPSAANEFGRQAHHLNQVIGRLNSMYSEINNLNSGLEKKIEERTIELKSSLDEVSKLKLQQDGDYFLTSLIVNPLAYNEARKSDCKIEFFMEQKKKFRFKSKEYQIGGDICIADVIELKDKIYTVFINGDAMGKSIQGAGGALVLGVIFKSIVSRTKLVRSNQNIFPEKWLKNAFLELQNAYESFDGSMLISVVMGIIENTTGMMYYINAEHPHTVLYRDEKTSFLEEGSALLKIGIKGLHNHITIRTFLLYPGDTIFIGSDGRDDILLRNDSEMKLFNEDETLFLKIIESEKGDLSRIINSIKKTGELSDDLSIIKIQFFNKETYPEAETSVIHEHIGKARKFTFEKMPNKAEAELRLLYEKYPYHKSSLIALINFYRTQSKWSEAVKYTEELSMQEPWNNVLLLKAGYMYFKSGQLNLAADYLERLKLRGTADTRCLLLLVKTYLKTNNPKRARKILDQLLYIDPNNKKGQELLRNFKDYC